MLLLALIISSTDNGIQSRPHRVKDKIVPKKVKTNSEESSATNIKRESAIVFSSPTPRSSSLYHPESDEEKTIGDNADKEDSDVDRTYSVEEDVGDDKDRKEVEPDYSSDNASEIAEELDD